MLELDDYRTRWLAFSERFLDAATERAARLVAQVVEDGLPPGEPSSAFDPSAAERARRRGCGDPRGRRCSTPSATSRTTPTSSGTCAGTTRSSSTS